MSKTMQPIRSNELNYWSNVVYEKFANRKKELETVLFQEVKNKCRLLETRFSLQ